MGLLGFCVVVFFNLSSATMHVVIAVGLESVLFNEQKNKCLYLFLFNSKKLSQLIVKDSKARSN